jgi:hypothetical protein
MQRSLENVPSASRRDAGSTPHGKFPPRRATRRMGRRFAANFGIGFVVSMLLAASGVLDAGAASAQGARSFEQAAAAVANVTGPAGADYATDVFHDPWDYSNQYDMELNFSGTVRTSGLVMANGQVQTHLTANSAYLSPVWAGYAPSQAVLSGRDGAMAGNAVNADRYRTASFQAYWNGTQRGSTVYLEWFKCPGVAASATCGGRSPTIQLVKGWHTYTAALGQTAGFGPQNWSGLMNGLRMVFNGGVSDFKLDWMRLSAPSSGQQVSVPTGTVGVWDVNSSDADNVSAYTGWGTIPAAGTRLDLSVLPAGRFRIGTRPAAGGSTTWRYMVTLNRPQPRLITPNPQGDEDYATAVLHNPWDMASSADVAVARNVAIRSWAGGNLSGQNAGTRWNDPQVLMKLPAAGINASTYHFLTVTTQFSGAFSLGSGPGGGAVSRLLWERADDRTQWTVSKAIVVPSGTWTTTVDLSQPLSALRVGGPALSFTSGARVTGLRWDPNEDPATGTAARHWQILDVKLRSNFRADGTFPITWSDDAYAPGGSATLRAATTPQASCAGTVIGSGIRVQPGVNGTLWYTRNLPAGNYWICLQITRNGVTNSTTAGGMLVVRHVVPRPVAPGVVPAPVAVRNGGKSIVTFKPAAGAVSGYQVWERNNNLTYLLPATARSTWVKCITPAGRTSYSVRAYGPGGIAAWSPVSNVIGC